jgi:N utilization substance protein B
MPARTKARKRALDVLFESELRDEDPLQVLAERIAQADPPVNDYTVRLVEGVTSHRERIDELLRAYSVGWPLDRMPTVDRNLLRIGVYELLWADDVPDAVAVNEAVKLAGELSTDDSAGFVNGLLARILALKPQLQGEVQPGPGLGPASRGFSERS